MINLENELLKSILDGMANPKRGMTPQDVQMFFNRSTDRLKRLVEIKELTLAQSKAKLKKLQAGKKSKQVSKKSNVVDRILNDLVGRLAVANLQFNDKKQMKYDSLIKELHLAVIHKRTPVIIRCLYNINSLQLVTKDLKMADLQEQIAKYSEMAHSGDKAYLKLYYEQEKQEDLLAQILILQTEIQALNTILNQR